MTDELKAKIEAIRELAGRATPGPWIIHNDPNNFDWDVAFITTHKRQKHDKQEIAKLELAYCADGNYPNKFNKEQHADAEYIAATNPQTMLEILAYIDQLEKQVDWLATLCADACDYRKGDCDGCAFCEQGICVKTDGKLADIPNTWREAAREAVK